MAEPSLPSHEGDRDPGGQPQGPTRGIIRGERASNKRKERRALEREGKPVPPWLQALKVPSLNKAENMERRKLQEQLQSLERQYNSAKSWEEQKKIWNDILETKHSLKRLFRRVVGIDDEDEPEEGQSSQAASSGSNTVKPDKAEDKTKIVEEKASSGSKTVKPEKAEEKTKTVEEVKQEGDKEEEGEEGWTTVDGKKKKRNKKKKEKKQDTDDNPMEVDWDPDDKKDGPPDKPGLAA